MRRLYEFEKREKQVKKGIDSVRTFKVVCGEFCREYRNFGNAVNAYFKHYDSDCECYIEDMFFHCVVLCNKVYKANCSECNLRAVDERK